MNPYKHILFIFIILSTFISIGQSQIKTTDFNTIESIVKNDPKPIVVFIHTDWCRYCKVMQQTTFKDPKVLNRLNTDFYFISFDAESKETVRFRNHNFEFIPNGNKSGVHQLALELGKINNQISYPSVVLLNSDFEIIFQHNSFLTPEQFNTILKKTPNS